MKLQRVMLRLILNINGPVLCLTRMLIKWCYILIFTLFLLVPPQIVLADSGIKIGLIGDQTGSDDLAVAYQALQQGVDLLNNQNLDLVLHVGDLVESREDNDSLRNQFNHASSILDTLTAPWYLTPGDHDVNPITFTPNSTDHSKERLFQQLYSNKQKLASEHFYYSFNNAGYHFISLYSQEHLHSDPRWSNVHMAKISEQQLDWLQSDLQSHSDSKGVIVFMHQPLWYNWSGWVKVHRLLRKYNVRAVIAGHYHYNQDDGELDGIRYLVVGATGANTKAASRNAGGIWHVSVLQINNTHLDVELIPLEGNPIEMSRREDMDRVQAVDYMLHDLSRFSLYNPLYISNGQLLNSCEAQTPANIKLANLGSPIDLAVTIQITPIGTQFTFSDARFESDDCDAESLPWACQMEAGKGIAIANNAMVKASYNNKPQQFWQAKVNVNNGIKLSGADKLQLHIKVSFEGDNGEFSIFKTLISPILSCPNNH